MMHWTGGAAKTLMKLYAFVSVSCLAPREGSLTRGTSPSFLSEETSVHREARTVTSIVVTPETADEGAEASVGTSALFWVSILVPRGGSSTVGTAPLTPPVPSGRGPACVFQGECPHLLLW